MSIGPNYSTFGFLQSFWKGSAVTNLAKSVNTSSQVAEQESAEAQKSDSSIKDEYIPSSVPEATVAQNSSDKQYITPETKPAAVSSEDEFVDASTVDWNADSEDYDRFSYLKSEGVYTKDQIDSKYWLNKRGIVTDLDEFIQKHWDDPSIETMVRSGKNKYGITRDSLGLSGVTDPLGDKYYEKPYEERYNDARTAQLTRMYQEQTSLSRFVDCGNVIQYEEGMTITAPDVSVKDNTYADQLLGVTYDQKQAMREDENVADAYFETAREERAGLDSRIAGLLEEAGLELTEDETLNINIDLNGNITVGEGIADAEKASAIENALNADSSLGREMLLNHAKQGLKVGGDEGISYDTDSTFSRIIANEALRSQTGLTLDDIDFDYDKIRFTDKSGNVDLSKFNSDDYMVFHGMYNNFTWNGDAYEKLEPLTVSLQITF